MTRGIDQQFILLNRRGQPMTRDGIAQVMAKHATAAARAEPTLRRKRIPPRGPACLLHEPGHVGGLSPSLP
jgi:hypothetical protein